MKKLSVITICYNDKIGLERTVKSVLQQTFTDYEYIVIDGGSTDDSLDIIQKYKDKFSYWVSEKDNGIYHAMNKGINRASGEYILFLNSGDEIYQKNVLNHIFSSQKGSDIIYGDIQIDEEERKWIKKYPSALTFQYFIKDTLPHPGSFIKRDLFEKIGNYNENNRIVSDWEFFLLAVNKFNCSYEYVPIVVSNFKYDGISSKKENLTVRKNERSRILSHHFPTFLKDYKELENFHKEISFYRNSRPHKLVEKLKKILKF